MPEWISCELQVGAHEKNPVSSKSNLVEAGLDSLAVTQLMLSIEEVTGVWMDESLLTPENLETSETLATCVYEQL